MLQLNFISCVVAIFLLFCNVGSSQDSHLQCYSCAHVESGDIGLVDGFQNSTLDESCKWGNRPNVRFLVNCSAVYVEPDYQYFHACVQMKVHGKITSMGKQTSVFNGSLWGCATRRVLTTQLPISGYNDDSTLISKECRQGALDSVKGNFQDATGREFLKNMSTVFNPEAKVKFCTCDFDACWDRGPPTTTTLRTTTTTEKQTAFPTEDGDPSTIETTAPDLGSASMKNTSLFFYILSIMAVTILTNHLSRI